MNLTLPLATHIRIDDVGWFDGRDRRTIGQPSSTGIPRTHHPLDVRAVNELGKALNSHIHCNMVIGEWDKYNRLRGVPHVTWDEAGWDMAGKLDMKLAGVLLLIFGIAMLVICFGMTRFFILLSVQVSKKPKVRDEGPDDDKNDLQDQ